VGSFESLKKIKDPLSFAARDNFRRLHVVKDLEIFVARWADAVRVNGDLPEAFVAELSACFKEFNTLSLKQKESRIRQSLHLIRTFEANSPLSAYQPQRLTGGDMPPEKDIRTMLRVFTVSTSRLKGVGPARLEKLREMGCETIGNLLYHFPFRYEDRRKVRTIGELQAGTSAYIMGTLSGITRKGVRQKGYLTAQISDGTGVLTLKWFKGLSYFQKSLRVGTRYHIFGEVKRFGPLLEIHHPDMEIVKNDGTSDMFGTFLPVYPETGTIGQKPFRKLMIQAFDTAAPYLTDPLPASLRTAYNFPSLAEGLKVLHCLDASRQEVSPEIQDFARARKRFLYETYFFLELILALNKRELAALPGVRCNATSNELATFIHALPFTLTGAQQRTLEEIFADVISPRPMNRLLQGDVGSGKTVVAGVAAALYLSHGYQVALMAPTEVLAQQHYRTFRQLPFIEKETLALLVGSHKASEKNNLHDAISTGEKRLVIGTHALIQKGVVFSNLGLVIIDEQHRFGVRQRFKLASKGPPPDLLMMTATPIPRTLSMTLYGDMDLSIIDELPPGRTPVVTRCVSGRKRGQLYTSLRNHLEKRQQVYVIYPLIEESEKLDLEDATTNAKWLREIVFPDYAVALLHGKLPSQEKQALMQSFQAGGIHVLVSTTVIEVGVDVPNATIMVIEHAERFGLSQLHQLRGRVGRGRKASFCYLVVHSKKSEDARKRLAIMEETTDGFKIAEADLAIRGPGDILGTRQSGSPLFMTHILGWDSQLLKQARDDAFSLLNYMPREALSGLLAYVKEKAKRWEELARI